MNIYASEGAKVKYTGKGGYDSDKAHADKFLKVGDTYTVDFTEAGDWTSGVFLKEVEGESFNTVHFEDVDEVVNKSDKLLKYVEDYFKNTPREKVLADWEKYQDLDSVGPTMDEFLEAQEIRLEQQLTEAQMKLLDAIFEKYDK